MPNSMYGLDAGFPQFTGKESVEQKVNAMYDYLVQLQQNMKYLLLNLGGENFNETELEKLGQVIREPIRLVVTNGKQSAEVQLKAGEAVLSAQMIKFDGVVTFTGGENDTAVIDGGRIFCAYMGGDIFDVGDVIILPYDGGGWWTIGGNGLTYWIGAKGGASQELFELRRTDEGVHIRMDSLPDGTPRTLRISSAGEVCIDGEVYINGKRME